MAASADCGAYGTVPATESVIDGAWRPSLNDVFSRGLFARSSNDVRHRCCAAEDQRRTHDRHRVVAGRGEPWHGPEREGARLPFLAYNSRRTVAEHRIVTSGVGIRSAESTRHADGPALDSTKHGRVLTRSTSSTVRVSESVHLPWRSNDVGRRSRTWRRGRGEKASWREGLQRPSTTIQMRTTVP